jgi:hypothetical protein
MCVQLVIAKLKMLQASSARREGSTKGAKDGTVLNQLSQALLGIPELSRCIEGCLAQRDGSQ